MEHIICDRLANTLWHYGREEPKGARVDACIGRHFGGVGFFLPAARILRDNERDFAWPIAFANSLCNEKGRVWGWRGTVLPGGGIGRREKLVVVGHQLVSDLPVGFGFAGTAQSKEEH